LFPPNTEPYAVLYTWEDGSLARRISLLVLSMPLGW